MLVKVGQKFETGWVEEEVYIYQVYAIENGLVSFELIDTNVEIDRQHIGRKYPKYEPINFFISRFKDERNKKYLRTWNLTKRYN